ncbi:hypothetical protein SAMN04488112_10489 [Melghirimyces thermohalophilus]|uniref:Uncharacterized protein n=1 Tax=Melghirimyces thermohalophilus TaxID=1236220 RepID=A0A1G6JL30_9BACL|nr:hypothetical protein SAMN04488112_10489 [Melghirimyces thermohalophilus]
MINPFPISGKGVFVMRGSGNLCRMSIKSSIFCSHEEVEPMTQLPTTLQFRIHPVGEISQAFLHLGIVRYDRAAEYVCRIPYGRNRDRGDFR